VKKHWKTIAWIAGGLGIGALVATQFNRMVQIATNESYQLYSNIQVGINWFIVVPVMLMLVGFIVVGYLIGMKSDNV
jgi:hypothetical protein